MSYCQCDNSDVECASCGLEIIDFGRVNADQQIEIDRLNAQWLADLKGREQRAFENKRLRKVNADLLAACEAALPALERYPSLENKRSLVQAAIAKAKESK